MYEIEMHEMSDEFPPCWQAAGEHLERQVDGGIQGWLRAHPYPPVLEHLSFRLGNQLFRARRGRGPTRPGPWKPEWARGCRERREWTRVPDADEEASLRERVGGGSTWLGPDRRDHG